MKWTPEEDDALEQIILDGLTSYKAVEMIPGRSRSACIARSMHLGLAFGKGEIGADRHEQRKADDRERRKPANPYDDRWTDSKLTETWAERKARLARERGESK